MLLSKDSKCNIVQRRCNHTFMFPLLAKAGSVPQLDFPSESEPPRSRWRVLLWERWPALAKMPCTADYSVQRSITGINFRIWVFFTKIPYIFGASSILNIAKLHFDNSILGVNVSEVKIKILEQIFV